MMALIDLDGTVILYSGIIRIGVLYGKNEFLNVKELSVNNQVTGI